MSARNIVAFLPCRAGSTRVRRKNTRPFAGYPGGLLQVKLDQLARTAALSAVIVDSNDPEVLELATAQRAVWSGIAELIVRERPDHLGQSTTSTQELIEYALETVLFDDLLWTHVTSPMIDEHLYSRAIAEYLGLADDHDSLMSVHKIQAFLWNHTGPVNYDRAQTRWPRTQDIAPLYQIDSGIFLVSRSVADCSNDRVGVRPKMFEVSPVEAIDVDWEPDFRLAELVYRSTREAR